MQTAWKHTEYFKYTPNILSIHLYFKYTPIMAYPFIMALMFPPTAHLSLQLRGSELNRNCFKDAFLTRD